MANTYTQIYIQIVFAVEGRQSLIPQEFKEELHKYIAGIVRGCDQKLLAIHCMPDHTHMFVGLKPTMALSKLVQEVKAASSQFIKQKGWVAGRFSWQEGFALFPTVTPKSATSLTISWINPDIIRKNRLSTNISSS